MKKTLIAAAVAAAVAAPAANAGVTIYGQIHASIDYLDAQTSAVCSGNGTTPGGGFNVCDRTSRIGFKGSEDLGNGLKAIWKMESEIAIADGGSPDGSGSWTAARNSYIGLAGDWGTFLYGRHDTPYKMAWYSTGIDMLGDSFMDVNSLYGFQEWRRNNAIAYVSPNMNGFTFAGAVIPAEGSPNPNDDGLADSYSIGLMYSNNGLRLAGGFEDTTGETGVDSQNWFVGAGYSMNNFDIAANYADQELGASDYQAYAVSMAYTMGNNKLIGTVGGADWDADDGIGYGVAVQHLFSKRTSAYLGYSSTEMLNAHRTPAYLGIDSEAISFGMIHKF